MYAFISGKLDSIFDTGVVIDNGGIGYIVYASSSVLSNMPPIGSVIKLYTYMQVKEDGVNLFGFLTREEKGMFLKLITITGVGCKMANQILSGLDATNLAIAIANKDVAMLSRIKGVGKKTAERIILELKEKIDITLFDTQAATMIGDDSAVSDAILALVSLGIGKSEAVRAVGKAREKTDKTDMLITLALRNMDK